MCFLPQPVLDVLERLFAGGRRWYAEAPASAGPWGCPLALAVSPASSWLCLLTPLASGIHMTLIQALLPKYQVPERQVHALHPQALIPRFSRSQTVSKTASRCISLTSCGAHNLCILTSMKSQYRLLPVLQKEKLRAHKVHPHTPEQGLSQAGDALPCKVQVKVFSLLLQAAALSRAQRLHCRLAAGLQEPWPVDISPGTKKAGNPPYQAEGQYWLPLGWSLAMATVHTACCISVLQLGLQVALSGKGGSTDHGI